MTFHRISRPEQGYCLEPDGEQLVLRVLCGGVGLYEVKIVLNEEERQQLEDEGFLDRLARDVQRDPEAYTRRESATS